MLLILISLNQYLYFSTRIGIGLIDKGRLDFVLSSIVVGTNLEKNFLFYQF